MGMPDVSSTLQNCFVKHAALAHGFLDLQLTTDVITELDLQLTAAVRMEGFKDKYFCMGFATYIRPCWNFRCAQPLTNLK